MKKHPQLATGCLYITGHPGEKGWRYCQRTIAYDPKVNPNKRPWCATHIKLVYRPVSEVNETRSAKLAKSLPDGRLGFQRR